MANFAPLSIEPLLRWGNYGVTFFFVLSGFVLSWSARPQSTRPSTFWWRRFARIYPAHAVALLMAIPVFYSFAPDPTQWWVKPVDLVVLLFSVVLLQGWFRDPAILFSGNPASWTLTCEAFFYALHPALNSALRRLGKHGALIAAAIVIGVAVLYRAGLFIFPGIVPELPWPVLRLSEFIIGMTLAQAFRCGWAFGLRPLWCYLGGAALVSALTLLPMAAPAHPLVFAMLAFSNELIIILCALTIAAVASRDIRSDRSLLRSKPLVWLGDLSYSFYLVHATVIYFLREMLGLQNFGWSNLVWYAVCLALAIGLAALLHYLVEKPFEQHLRRWWDQRQRVIRAAVSPVES